jgi:hypothetical protein
MTYVITYNQEILYDGLTGAVRESGGRKENRKKGHGK